LTHAALPRLRELARRRAQPITVFDLETTTNIPYVAWMGVTEVGLLTIQPDGRLEETSAFVDPERNIPPFVRELTGITNKDVRGQPTWDVWKERFHEIAANHLVVGYNCLAFDCVVVVKQSERYGLSGTEFAQVLDVKALPGVSGKLGEAAAAHGVLSTTFHRAMADVWTTALLAEAVAEKLGIEALEGSIGKAASFGSGNSSPREEREKELAEFYAAHGQLPDLDAFGEAHGIKRSTAEGDVTRLIEASTMPRSVLENPAVQEWLAERIEAAIEVCWVGEAQGRLKPLFVHFEGDAPPGFDYTQLRLALGMRGTGDS